jgi:hypothetical protein
MKNAHVTLRLPAAIARALERNARTEGVPKSQVVREALAHYFLPVTSSGATPRAVTAAELVALWPRLPRLTPDEAGKMADDIADARKKLPLVKPKWE